MTYITIAVFLFFSTFITKKNEQIHLFKLFILFLAVFLCLRFGSGTDFFNYYRIYRVMPNDYKNFWVLSYLAGVEPFYYLVNIFARRTGWGFQFVIIFTSIVSCFFIYKLIKKYSDSKVFSLFILFCNYYFYMSSALRQCEALVIGGYAVTKYANDNKLSHFLFFVFVAMMFHTSAFILLIVPIMFHIRIDFTNPVCYLFLFVISIAASFIVFPLMIAIASTVLPKYAAYKTSLNDMAFLSIGVRFIFSALLLYIYRYRKNEISSSLKKLVRLYLFGSLLFYLLSSSDQASRLTDYFTVLEIIIFPNILVLIPNKKRRLSTTFYLACFLFLFLFIKDLKTAAAQGQYRSKNFAGYPYITIFNKDAVLKYRQDVPDVYIRELRNTD